MIVSALTAAFLMFLLWRLARRLGRKVRRKRVVTVVEITGKDPRSCLMVLER